MTAWAWFLAGAAAGWVTATRLAARRRRAERVRAWGDGSRESS